MTECRSGKEGHRSRIAARRAAVAVARKRTHDRPRVYHCPDCHRWHLTSTRDHARHLARGAHDRLQQPAPASRAELDAWFAEHLRAPA
jgi:hypothetical protein